MSPVAGHPLALLNLEAIRERGFVVVPSAELEHLQAVADVVAHLLRLGLLETQDEELREHLVALGLLAVEPER